MKNILNLSATIVSFLKQHLEQKFTSREIAQWIFENYPDECRENKIPLLKKATNEFFTGQGGH